MPYPYWAIPNRYSVFISGLTSTLHREFKVLLGVDYKTGHTFLFISLFLFIIFNNLLGLLPYVFTASSHLSITLALALPLWLGFIFFG